MPAGKSSRLNRMQTPPAPVPRGQAKTRAGDEASPPSSLAGRHPAGPNTKVRPELIDVMMDVYVDWREECIALRNAYERWSSVGVAERGLAFAAYRAALDREDWASAVYADLVKSVERELEASNA